MQPNNYQLLILLLIPLVGAVAAPFMPDNRTTRRWALLVSVAALVYAAYLAVQFFMTPGPASASSGGGMKFGFSGGSFQVSDIGFAFRLGMDAISVWLVLLTVLLMP